MYFLFTEEEFDFITQKFKQSKFKYRTDFILKCVAGTPIINVDLTPFWRIFGVLSNAANDLNKITRHFISENNLNIEDLKPYKEQINQVYRMVSEPYDSLPKK